MFQNLKNKLHRIIYSLLISRNYCKRGAIVNIQKGAYVFGNYFDGEIVIGKGSRITRTEIRGKVTIGRYSSLNGPNLDIYAGSGSVSIGNFCSIARNVSFQVEGHNHSKITTYQIFKNVFNEDVPDETIRKGNIEIGHDVWIGTQSVILGNIKVGNGAVIAANSVVNNDVPPYAIVAGSPARIIKYRFSENLIEKIGTLKWWEWDDEKLFQNKKLFGMDLSMLNDEFDFSSMNNL